MNIIIITLFVYAFVTISYVTGVQKMVTCDKEGEQNLEMNISKFYLFGSQHRSFPTNDRQMRKYCRENSALQNEIKIYSNKCLVRLSKQVVNLLIYSIAKNNNNLCKSQKRKRAFIQLGNCGNAAKAETIKCWNNTTLSIDALIHYRNNKLKMPLLCCHFFRFQSCTLKGYEKQAKHCDRKSVDGLTNLLNVYTLDVLRVMCGEYNDENDKCDRIIDETPKSSNSSTLQHNSDGISLIIKILEGIPEF